MTAFLDKQGKLVLTLVLILGLFYFVAYALNSKPKNPPEAVVMNYLTALKTNDINTAYSLLSEEDREYFDIDRFRMFLYRQPQLQLLYGGGEVNRNKPLRDYMTFVQVEPKDKENQPENEILMKITLPDVSKVLGNELLQYYLFGEEHRWLTTEQSMKLSKRLEARLRNLGSAPLQSAYQEFTLVKHKGNWQLSVPEWRAEAILFEAKQKLIDQETKEAALLLNEASSFVLHVNELTRKTVVSEAIAGNQMLRYLPDISIDEFRMGRPLSSCQHPVKLELENEGERSIRSLEISVQYMDEKNKNVVDTQVLGLDKTSLEKQDKSRGFFMAPQETVIALSCLRPPRDWSGTANTHVVWLKFSETAQ
jgi:hypothetical protein